MSRCYDHFFCFSAEFLPTFEIDKYKTDTEKLPGITKERDDLKKDAEE